MPSSSYLIYPKTPPTLKIVTLNQQPTIHGLISMKIFGRFDTRYAQAFPTSQ